MEKKMTKKEMFTLIAKLNADNAEIVDFCNHEIELLDRKKSQGNAKANEKMDMQVELVYKALVLVNRPIKVSELIAETDLSALENDSGTVSSQKVSALLKKLVDSKRVKRIEDKKNTLFVINTDNE